MKDNNIIDEENKVISEIQNKILNVPFPMSKIKEFVKFAEEMVKKWFNNKEFLYISNDFDHSDDCPGKLLKRKIEMEEIKEMIEGKTLLEWCQDNYTGNSIPSFRDILYETYEYMMIEHIKMEILDFYSSKISTNIWGEMEDYRDDIYNYIDEQNIYITEKFLKYIDNIYLQSIFLEHEKEIENIIQYFDAQRKQ